MISLGIKDLIEDLNPQLLKTITAEFDKVEGNPAPEPVRTSADVASMAVTSGGGAGKAAAGGDPLDDLFPRVEIDGLLKGTTILADTKSDAWKTKKEALETLQAILDQGANKRLKPTMGMSAVPRAMSIFSHANFSFTGEIGQVLKARVTDSNKAVQSLALDIVARIATGMGKPFDKQCRFFVLPLSTVLADQKAPIRASALQSLTAIANACETLEPMIPGIATALESANPLQRSSLMGWLVDWLKEHPYTPGLDINTWAGPIVSSLDDRNGDVRKAAQALLPTLISSAGFDYVMAQTNSLKPASKSTAVPLIQAARGTAPATASAPVKVPVVAKPAAKPAAAKPAESPSPSELSPPPTATAKAAPISKLSGVRRKLPQGSTRPETPTEAAPPSATSRLPSKLGTGLKRPGATVSTAAKSPPPATAASMPLVGANPDAKKARLAKDAQRWINESGPTRKDLAELLQHQMESHASRELIGALFSRDHNAVNDHVMGLSMMYEFYSAAEAGDERFGSIDEVRAVCIANSDLSLKYVSMKAHEPQSNLVQKCLDVVESVLAFFQSVDYQASDAEALCFIPTMVHKVSF